MEENSEDLHASSNQNDRKQSSITKKNHPITTAKPNPTAPHTENSRKSGHRKSLRRFAKSHNVSAINYGGVLMCEVCETRTGQMAAFAR